MRLMLAAASAALLTVAAQAQAAPPPASAFGRVPAVVDAVISPNGKRVAILGGTSDQRFVSIATIDDPALPVLPLGDAEVVGLSWAGDDHVLARVGYWEKYGPRLAYRFERNVSITPQAKAVARLLDGDAFSQYLIEQPVLGTTLGPPAQVFVMGLLPGEAVGGMDTRIQRKGEDGYVRALFKVDPATGKGVRIERGDSDTIGWELNTAGEPRVRLDIDELSHRFTVYARGARPGQWTVLWDGGDFDSRRRYLGYSAPEDAIYLFLDGAVVRKRVSDGATETVSQIPADTSPSLLWDSRSFGAFAILTGGERPVYHWLDPEIGAVHTALSKAFKTQDVWLYDWSADRTRFLVRVSSPSSPATWHIFDKARKELSPLGDEYPDLKDVALGQAQWITYKARDGLEIPAYLTLPPGAAPNGKPPLIVLPHGGPEGRDVYDFDYLAQFLATRGYAVLQPQFRGSWGFGDAFEKAGKGEWGGKMQTDLLDGVAAVAATGQIDASRTCIVGGSFGGYAALAGATLHSDAYRCAASIAGITDLGFFLVQRQQLYGESSGTIGELRTALGAASKDKLAATSPARLAANIKTPILLIHGDRDTIVPPEQSQKMVDAMKAAGKPVEYVVLENENHYLTRSATRTQTLEALERFLAKHLPVTN